jgi:hypothetical protein
LRLFFFLNKFAFQISNYGHKHLLLNLSCSRFGGKKCVRRSNPRNYRLLSLHLSLSHSLSRTHTHTYNTVLV